MQNLQSPYCIQHQPNPPIHTAIGNLKHVDIFRMQTIRIDLRKGILALATCILLNGVFHPTIALVIRATGDAKISQETDPDIPW